MIGCCDLCAIMAVTLIVDYDLLSCSENSFAAHPSRKLLLSHGISSQISATAKYGIITSQFHRLRRIILSGDNFTFRMGGIIHYMTTKGHDAGRMLGQVKGMCKQFPEMYGRDPWRLAEGIQQAFFDISSRE